MSKTREKAKDAARREARQMKRQYFPDGDLWRANFPMQLKPKR